MKKFKGLFKGKGASGSQSDLRNSGQVPKNGYDIKEKDLPKLHKAAWNGDLIKVKNLAKKDVNSLDKENRSALHLASVQGHASVVQELLEWHAKPNKGDHDSKTPLMKAVECNQEECVKLLLEYRTEVNVVDRDANTALHLAVKEGHTNIVALLISSGANLNLKNREGQTPLHLSVLDTTKRDDIARLLLENGASPNEVDRNDRSALHHACHEDSINHVKLLLKHNANTFLKDSRGWSAEDCAMMKANHGCSQLVYDYNLKKKPTGGSLQSTPRNPPSLTQSTPRGDHPGSDLFGLPQAEVMHEDDDSDEVTSKMSGTVDNPESWGDDTDVSYPIDDPRKKLSTSQDSDIDLEVWEDEAAPKISLTKNVKLEDDESEPENQTQNGTSDSEPSGRPPIRFRKQLVKQGKSGRVVYSRTPTPTTPGVSPSPNFGVSSKIPVRKQSSSVEGDSDDEDDSSPPQRNRVKFNETKDVRQFANPTDDDTDIDEDEGVEPIKKRRIQKPEEEVDSPYLPPGFPVKQKQNTMTEEQRREMMNDLGLEDEEGDFSDEDVEEISEEEKSPRDNQVTGSQPNTPRGILKQPKNTNDKPPSVHRQVESDEIIVEAEINIAAAALQDNLKEEESDWDSTKYSDVERQLSDREPVTGGTLLVQVHSGEESPEVDSDLEDTLNPEHSNMEKTSQWDSTADEFTPRTPRENATLGNKPMSPEVKDIEFEDEDEEEIDDQIEEVVTAFNTESPALQTSYTPSIPSYQTPEPTSDSSHPRTQSTPDPHTSSTSAGLRTVITAGQEEPVQVKQIVNEDGESDWDSEDDVQSDEDVQDAPGHVEIQLNNETPRSARSHTSHTVSDEESASEWELERQREKQTQQEEADRLLREKEERTRQEKERARQEEERARQEEERARQEEERARQEEEKVRQEKERAKQAEEEMRKLAELEEEEERQRQWELEEQKRQELLDKDAQAELEREIRESQDISDVSDFVDEDDDILPDDTMQPAPYDNMNQDSDHLDSEKSEPTEEIVKSQYSDRSNPMSPRNRGLKKPPPKLVVSNFLQSPKELKTPVQMGEVENESPAFFDTSSPGPGYDLNIISPVQQYSNQSPPVFNDIIEPARQFQNQSSPPVDDFKVGKDKEVIVVLKENGVDDSDEDVDLDFDEDDLQVMEEVAIKPVSEKAVEGSSVFLTQSELPKPIAPESNHNDASLDLLDISPSKVPVSAPSKAMSLQSDGQSPEEDELDSPRDNKPSSSPFNLPDYSGTTGLYKSGLDIPFDDDGLSVTSTENGDISTSYRPENLPYGKDMLVNMNLNDSNAVLKLQEHLREHRRQLEHERGQRMLVDNKHKLILKEKTQLQKSIDSLKYQKSALEQNKLDLEAKIRNLEYQVNEEEEKRKNSELLLKKTKDHLAKKEEQFAQEMEGKQRAELAMRNIQSDLRTAQNQIKDLEEEKAEVDRLLANERNARNLQEKINDEQQRLQQHINEEAYKTSTQREEDGEDAESALEVAGVDIKQAKDLLEKMRNENTALKAEIQRQRLRLTEENMSLTTENEKLQQRVEDLKNEVRLNEEALTQYTVQQNLHQSKLVSENAMLNNSIDKERVVREKLEAELESSKNRLHATVVELEKSQQARNEFERRLHGDREEWARQLERKDQEMASIKDKLNSLMHTLNETESKLNSVENELHISNSTLLERTNQQQLSQRDLQYYKTAQDNYDANLRHEKEQNAKLIGKVESLQDRLSNLQHENLSLKQQVELAHQSANDRSGVELQDKLNTMIGNLKTDHDKARSSLEDKNTGLQDTISRLREEVRNSENRRSNLEQDIRRLNQDQNDLIRKLSIAEASLDVAQKARDHLEQERVSLKMDMEKLQQRYQTSQEKTIEAQTRMTELAERLDKTEHSRLMSTQQLVDTSATMAAFNTSKTELEENYQKLQVDNVRMEAELKHEKQKSEMLHRDLLDSQKVRSSLEALCSNLKSTNAHLEEKLGGEVANRALLLRETEDHKGLWEQEVLSRSKLGIRIAQLEKHKQENNSQLEEEKRKSRRALEQKRLAESKLESEQEKCMTLQKEVASLKAYLKVAKKRLKVMDTNETRVNTMHSAFDNERHAMEDMMVSVKAQLEHMKLQLQDEMDEKERVQQKNVQLETELKTIQKLEKSVQKIDRSKRKLEKEFVTYKNNVEAGYTDKASVEEMKRDVEARYRMELNRKLDEVNNYLEEQARTRSRLDTSRDDQESKLRTDKKKLEEEVTDLRIRYEQSAAKLESKETEAKRFRDLYESEMQWRMRLSEQLCRSTDKAFSFKNKLVAERQRSRMYGSLTNLAMNSMNGHAIDLSRINGTLAEDALGHKLRAELDRSIAKHLEAAPHDQMHPLIRGEDSALTTSNFAKANSDYIELLKRKYCV